MDKNLKFSIEKTIENAKKSANRYRSIAWGNHIELLKQEMVPLDEFIKNILSIPDKRIAAACSMLYLTGSRVSEVVRNYRKKAPSIKLKDIRLSNDGDYIIITTPVLKLRNSAKIKKNPLLKIKKTYLKLDENDVYYPLWNIIDEYIDSFPDEIKNNPDSEIFPISSSLVEKKLSKYLGWNPHYIRHLRASHLVIYHNFNDTDLRKFFGWVTGEMPTRYTHLSDEMLKEKLFNFNFKNNQNI